MSKSIIKLAVGCPWFGAQVTAHQARMWLELGNTLGSSQERFKLVMFSFVDINGIDKARNELVNQAIRHDADWLLMIDADTWVEGVDGDDAGFYLLRMISEADRAGASVVVAPVVRRTLGPDETSSDPHEIMVYQTVEDSKPFGRNDGLKPLWFSDLAKPFTEIDAAATAVMAINLNKTIEMNFSFTDKLSEDLHFCAQVRAKNGKILVDKRVRTGHLSRQAPLYVGG